MHVDETNASKVPNRSFSKISMVLHEHSAISDTLGKIEGYSQKRAKRDVFPFSNLFEKRDKSSSISGRAH